MDENARNSVYIYTYNTLENVVRYRCETIVRETDHSVFTEVKGYSIFAEGLLNIYEGARDANNIPLEKNRKGIYDLSYRAYYFKPSEQDFLKKVRQHIYAKKHEIDLASSKLGKVIAGIDSNAIECQSWELPFESTEGLSENDKSFLNDVYKEHIAANL